MTFFKYVNVFGKPEGQNDACISYALARKGKNENQRFFHPCTSKSSVFKTSFLLYHTSPFVRERFFYVFLSSIFGMQCRV